MSDLPKTSEEFQLWMVEKVGEIHTSQATLLGEVRVASAQHEALKDRVTNIEATARTAKHWENGKFLATFFVHGILNAFKIHI